MAITWKKIAYEDDCLLEADFNAKGDLLSASADNTPEVLTVGANDKVLVAASGETSGLKWDTVPAGGTPAAHKDSHDPNDGSDPLDSAAPAELADVQAAAVGVSHSFARADHAHQIQHDITDNHLVTIDGSPADTEIALWNAGGLDGATPAAVAASMALDDIGVPDAAVDFDLQEATDLVVMTVANEAGLPAANVKVGQLCWATAELSLHMCIADV